MSGYASAARVANDMDKETVTAKLEESPFVQAIEEYLGSGHFGSQVFRCRVTGVSAPAVVTVLSESRIAYKCNGAFLSRLHHPNVLRIYNVLTDDVLRMVITECCSLSIQDWVDGNQRAHGIPKLSLIPWEKRLDIVQGMFSGLSYLHEAGLCHRHLQASKCYLHVPIATSTVKLGGLVRARPEAQGLLSSWKGKVIFCAPEFLEDSMWERAADVYALSIVAYMALTGIEPFADVSNFSKIVLSVMDGSRPDLDLLEETPQTPSLVSLLAQCWDASDQKRLSAEEVKSELQALTGREAV
eukprot:TRINITY_DN66549_c0_g1_i1.p1 TRINITY_DN66549_c0_g1~~TRINITY_DN66549_c0_g1_i1.p1  ORF type:complete len:299 (-),score=38.36 TRINITY_DN66549_c0_g1_i1:42-938(-)